MPNSFPLSRVKYIVSSISLPIASTTPETWTSRPLYFWSAAISLASYSATNPDALIATADSFAGGDGLKVLLPPQQKTANRIQSPKTVKREEMAGLIVRQSLFLLTMPGQGLEIACSNLSPRSLSSCACSLINLCNFLFRARGLFRCSFLPGFLKFPIR
jgi:hypothetical protein